MCRSPSRDTAAGVSFFFRHSCSSRLSCVKLLIWGPDAGESRPSRRPSPLPSPSLFQPQFGEAEPRLGSPNPSPLADPALQPDWGAVGRQRGQRRQTAPQYPAPHGTGEPPGTISGVLKEPPGFAHLTENKRAHGGHWGFVLRFFSASSLVGEQGAFSSSFPSEIFPSRSKRHRRTCPQEAVLHRQVNSSASGPGNLESWGADRAPGWEEAMACGERMRLEAGQAPLGPTRRDQL